MDENRITYFGETDARNKRVKFGIKAKDRTKHVYVIGKTGMGKSTLLENMAVQDIQSGAGMAFIDPHGKTADLLLEYVPKERVRDVIYIAPFDTDHPISFNVLESVDPTKRHLVSSGLMSTFKKIWEDAWSARMEYILTNTLLALLEAPGTTLLGVNRMLSDKAYRNEIVAQVKDPSVKAFWTKEFANYTERQAAEAVPAIQNKVGQFTANPLIRNMIGQPVSSFDFRKAMDERKIIIINLSKGRIGDENMKLLGGLLVTKIYLAAMSRADMPDRVVNMLPNFYLFVDEFQNFANASFADILSEARKYKLNLTIAHQYVEQMEENVAAAVFGNVGTMIVFRVGATDAEVLEKEFAPTFEMEDLVNLGAFQMYLKLMIDGLTSPPFSSSSLPPIKKPTVDYVKDIIAASREQYAIPRSAVEEIIMKFHEPTVVKKVENKLQTPVTAKSEIPNKSQISNLNIKTEVTTVKTTSAPIVITSTTNTTNITRTTNSVPIENTSAQKVENKIEKKSEPKVESHQPFKKAFLAAPVGLGYKRVERKELPVLSDLTVSRKGGENETRDSRLETRGPVPISGSNIKFPVSNLQPSTSNLQSPSTAPLSSLKPANVAVNTSKDTKTQTSENVNQLKNALAAAMAKGKANNTIHDSLLRSDSFAEQARFTNKANQIQNSNFQTNPKLQTLKTQISSTSTVKSDDSPQKPKEVPEEVLKNVLKVE